MTMRSNFAAFLVALFTVSLSTSALAQSNAAANSNGNKYGQGKPVKVKELPPGQLRNGMESLPPGLQKKALEWLQRHDFNESSVESLRVDPNGGIYYADYGLAVSTDPLEAAQGPVIAEALDPVDLFKLHSKPGSSNVLYLDFDGHTITGTAWNNGLADTLQAVRYSLSYDPDGGDPPPSASTFTEEERKRIHEIWHRIAEDYAAYDLDVTTEEPAVFTSTTGHLVFTHDEDANGNPMPAQGAGGVAYVGLFGYLNYDYYSPALVYYTNLYTNFPFHGDASLISEAGSHEFGHNLNLSHDGPDYYDGHGSGLVRWGPIMGGSYQDSVTQFSQGEYPTADNSQDDLAIIASYLGYDNDDEGDDAGSAAALTVEADGSVLVSNPEIDPFNVLPGNKGVIEDRNDIDWWYLDVGAGPLTLAVTPAWHAFNSSDYATWQYRGANLDISIELYDASLTLLDSNDPNDDTQATVSTIASAGRHYLRIDGVGNDVGDGYTDYGSIGMYFIEGDSTPAVADGDPPTPDPMTWAVSPNATGPYSMNMVASQASDPSGVEYYFVCVVGGAGCVDSGWQASRTHDATGLTPNTFYSWNVRARDGLGNVTAASSSEGDTTEPLLPPDGAPDGLTATAVSTSQIGLAWSDNSSNELTFQIERSNDGADWAPHDSVAANVTSYQDTGLNPYETWYYRVFARNAGGDSTLSNEASATTLAECSESMTIAAGEVKAFALPCDPGSATVSEVFSAFDMELMGSAWLIYYVDNANKAPVILGPDSTLPTGKFYAMLSNIDATITVSGSNISTMDLPLTTTVSASRDGDWNMLGYTGRTSLPWASVVPMDGSSPQDWDWADRWRNNFKSHLCDLDPVDANCRVRRVMHKWNGSAFEPWEPTGVNAGTLEPWDAFLVEAFADNTALRIPQMPAAADSASSANAAGTTANKNANPKKNSKDWHVRLIAESGRHKDRGNALGQLKDSTDGQDSHDLEEFPPISGSFLTILFDNPAFEASNWGFSSDFRALTKSPGGEWLFTVRSSPDIATVTLKWKGDRKALSSATLTNLLTGESVAAEPGGSYTFDVAPGGNTPFSFKVE